MPYHSVRQRFIEAGVPFALREDVFTLILSLPVIFYSCAIFFTGAVRALRARTLDMMVLVAVAVGAGWTYSLVVTLAGGGEVFYEAATVLASFVLLGHWFEMRARGGANVTDGESEVDESMVTGESLPVHKEPGRR